VQFVRFSLIHFKYIYQNITVTQEAGTTAINSDIMHKQWTIYPNPVSNKFIINNPGMQAKIALFTAGGKKLLAMDASSAVTEINIGNFNPGIYLLQIESFDQVIVNKILKE
jgi:hypothetical protein